MSKGLRRRTVYAATIVAALAMIGGYVVATTISQVPQAAQNGAFGGSTNVAGVTTTAMQTSIAGSAMPASTATIGSPLALPATTQTVSLNVNSIAQQDYFEQVTISIVNPGAGSSQGFEITLDVNTGVSATPVNVYVETNSGFVGATITLNVNYDLGSGSGGITVSAVSDLITQCTMSGATISSCP
ncbi:MAG TPA: hypothetical protein VJS68_00195 [Thermoplasmata archaeon]|nr:hypothetical protein [Thermoplasmata archaeon]